MNKLKIEQYEDGIKRLRLTNVNISFYFDTRGNIEVNIHGMKKGLFEKFAKMLQKDIGEHDNTRWINFSKARDGSRTVIFEIPETEQ